MKLWILAFGLAFLSTHGIRASEPPPSLEKLRSLVGKKADYPPLVAFLEDYGFGKDYHRLEAWECAHGLTVEMESDLACIGIRPLSKQTARSAYRGELPSGLKAGDDDATIVKKLGKPVQSSELGGVYSEMIYDGLAVYTSAGKLYEVWLIPPGSTRKNSGSANLVAAATGLEKIAAEFKLGSKVSVDADNRTAELSFNTRKFMVHSGSKVGSYSKEAHEATGPDVDGLIVRVQLVGGRYMGAAVVPQSLRRPYWSTFINAYSVAKGKQHLYFSISTGARTEAKLVAKIRELMESLQDGAS